ncbi:TetR/AcrR family transcriptional regulator [Leucobacter allii]|uniref:TetR/AcrR family transcriptional regulator n=1 Tax=Leucobacter allii TaxID=2932247 RepID=A0ABY4FN95_9MICO|nr:TetR/AcrR family transcriptional regulator [Leucobacter allii]UOQ57754.1 TetR/AcrR family transcriptional regulator [Leucobacter allii]
MSESATGVRAQRRAETARRITDLARRRTAERGITAYTVEELCEDAGVSRRTFFNYFASKEDAVLGVPAERDDAHFVERFLDGAAGSGRGDGGLTDSLVDDLVALFEGRWRSMGFTLEDARALFAALDREPRLHRRVLEHLRESELADIALVERREGLPPGDRRASTLVHLVGAMNRIVAEEYFVAHEHGPVGVDTYTELLRERIEIARSLLR